MSEDFARECKDAAKALRGVPKDLRRALSHEAKDRVATPLAGRIRSAASGPWARVLAAGTKARAGADPTIVVGGQAPRLSGGGGPRSVVYGVEFGGGTRTTAVPSRAGRRGYRRRSTRQFVGRHDPFVYPTISASMPRVLDTYADIVMDVLGEAVDG